MNASGTVLVMMGLLVGAVASHASLLAAGNDAATG
jgi:hypothetical protein